ncbi:MULTISPECIES: hypothetical protein [Streptomyces]|uniref:hypothetical protein n=1 Tax=Streptomyces TaxID=1883 RepID=UPI000AE25901|nr:MULTISPECIES: hypothetical protein [Streptomyces]
MPDRSRPSSPPQDSDSQGPESRGTGSQGTGKDDDNPFAPPPEGTPDRPWQPRRPSGDSAPDGSQGGEHGSPWGSQWSDRQPGRSPGGFGDRPGQQQGGPQQEGPSGPGNGGGLRWDPTDPAQRRARYALLSGMWAFFFALFGWRYVALLLGALALMWAVQALRAKQRTPDPAAPAAQGSAPRADQPAVRPSTRPQTTAAVSGLVTGALALVMVAGTFTAQLVYRDYYTCVDDALTSASKQNCEDLLPKQLRPLLGEQDDD